MEKQLIVIKIKDGDPLRVNRERLTENSEFLKHLIDDLHFYEIEMDDFDPDVVALFLTFLEDKHLNELETFQFRELHKMATVFEVDWLKESCRNWLFSKMDSEETEDSHEELLFVFEECLYVLRKWEEKEKDMMETFISKRAREDNSGFVAKYLKEDLDKLDTVQLGLMLKLDGNNTKVFLNAMLADLCKVIISDSPPFLGNKESLDQNMKFLLQNIDLPLCCSQNQWHNDELFECLCFMTELTWEDSCLISKLYMESLETAKLTRTKSDEAAKLTENSVLTTATPTTIDTPTATETPAGTPAVTEIASVTETPAVTGTPSTSSMGGNTLN